MIGSTELGTNGMSDWDGGFTQPLLDNAGLVDNSALTDLQRPRITSGADPFASELDYLLNSYSATSSQANRDTTDPSSPLSNANDPWLLVNQPHSLGFLSEAQASTSDNTTQRDTLTGATEWTVNESGDSATEQRVADSLVPTMGIARIGLPGYVYRIPDLVMREAKIEQVGNTAATVFWRVENTIDSSISRGAAVTSAWADRLYLSSDNLVSADDIVLAAPQGPNFFENQPPLAAGGVYTRSEQVSLDLATAAAGARPYLLVTTNAIVENLARPREYDDYTASDELQVGSNNTVALDLRTIPQPDDPNQNPYNFQPNGCGESSVAPLNSEVELHSGAVQETHNLVGYQSQGVNRGLTLQYNSLHADPRPIVHFGYSKVSDQAGEQLLIAKLTVQRGSFVSQLAGHPGNQYGLTGGEHFWEIPDANTSQRVQAALQLDLRAQPSGVYQYQLQRGIQTLERTAPQFQALTQNDQGTLVSINRRNSVFGHGWSLAGWQEVVVNPDNSVVLIDGDGSPRLFQAPTTAGGAYVSPTGDHSRLERLSDGSFQRTLKDQTVYRFDTRNQLAEVRDRNGNTTRYVYNASGQLQQIVDPVGLTTTFTYTNDRVTSIADPSGRVTQLTYSTAGDLQRVTDPGNVSRTWEYDSQSRMTAEVDPRNNREQTIYDLAGRADRSQRQDGSTINVDPVQVKGLYSPTQTINPLQAPVALTPTDIDALSPEALYVDGRNNVSRTRLNQSGNVLSSSDAVGSLGSFDRCDCGQVDAVTDGRGNTTSFVYDSQGNLTGIQDSLSGTRSTTFTYDPTFNQLTSMSDELGRQTLYQLDPRGNVLSMQQVVGAVGGTDDRISTFTYLSNGLIDTSRDALGRITDFDYDARGRLITATLAKGTTVQSIERYEYDNAGNRTALVDAKGNRTGFVYDSRNRLIKMTETDPDGAGALLAPVTTFSYDAADNLLAWRNARSQLTQYGYDKMNRVIRDTAADPDGAGPATAPVTLYSYDTSGNLSQSTDPLGRITRFAYDARNRLAQMTVPDPDGAAALASPITRYSYDLNNNLIALTNPHNFVTQFEYDARNRLTRQTTPDPDGAGAAAASATALSYDAANQLTQITDANSQTTRYIYDALGQLITLTEPDPDGAGALAAPVTQYRYDLVGNRTAIVDPLGRTTTYQYDALDRLTRSTSPDPDGAGALVAPAIVYGYDAVGNLISQADALGQTSRYGYDALNRQVTVTDPLNQVTRYSYDANDNLTAVLDPLNNSTSYTYDNLDRLTQDTNALNLSRTYRYDAVDNLIGATDRNGRQRSFVYDQLDRRTAENWLDATGATIRTFTYQYDVGSRLSAAFDPASRYSYSYDAMDRLTAVDNNGTANAPRVVFNYTYDAMSNLRSSADSINGTAQGKTDYTYDLLNRVTRMTQSGTGVTNKRVDLTYNAASQLTQLSRFSDLAGTQAVAATTYSYDPVGRLTQTAHARAGTNLATYGINYDAANRLTRLTTPEGTTDYSYDARAQLRSAYHSYQTDESYTYDANGNRTNTGYQTATNNRLTSDGVFSYQYDNEGNRIRRTRLSNGEVTDYTWDHRQRLTEVTLRVSAGGAITRQVNYAYDLYDQRLSKTVDLDGAGAQPVTTERYVYDRGQIALVFNGSNALTQRYLYGTAVDLVLAEQTGTNTTWALSDHQGTVRDLIDSSGTNLNRIRYDSFGNITNQTNSALSFRFGYTGRDFDSETGLSYYRARYYDAAVGRFLSEDPIGFAAGDTNLSRYVGNSPINFTDSSGLFVANLVGAGVGASTDLGLQLLTNSGKLSQVNWTSVAVSAASGSLGVGLASKAGSLTTSIAGRIALNAAGGAVIGAGDRLVRNALDGNCLGDNVLTSALAGGALGAAGESVSQAAHRVIGSLSGALGSADDAARAVDNAAVRVLDVESLQRNLDARMLAQSVEELRLSGTVASHLNDFKVRQGPDGSFFTESNRPFINSPLLYQEIMSAKTPIPDPRGVTGALRWDVPGSFRGRKGTWELVVDKRTKTVLHFNFVGDPKK